MTSQKTGEFWILMETLIFAFFPIIASQATRLIPPIFFAGVCTFIAGTIMLLYLIATRQLHHLKNTRVLKYLVGAALLIAFFPQIFIFIGASMTSAINIAILWQMEIVFSLVFCALWYSERITRNKLIGALFVMLGATAILYRGSLSLNLGDLFIVIGVAIFPFGNMCTKEALKLVPAPVVLFFRSFTAGLLLLAVSATFENFAMSALEYLRAYYWIFLVNGIVVLGLSKLMWYRGLKYLDIGKAISMSQSAPAFTLLYLLVFFGEIPTAYQWLGAACVMVGLFFATRKPLALQVAREH